MRDQLVAGGEIDAEVAWVLNGRAGDTQVNFLGTGGAELLHFFAGRGAANDRVVHDDNPLAGDDIADDVEF